MANPGTGERKLGEPQKQFVLSCLAVGMGLSETAGYVKEVFAIAISKQTVKYYADHYTDEIDRLREDMTGQLQRIPFANKHRRILALDRAARKLEKKEDYPELRTTLRQIAEEAGDLIERKDVTVNAHERWLEGLD